MSDINNVMLQGTIVHKFTTPKVAILTIGTGNATPTTNYPKVLFFGKDVEDINENYKIGEHVSITGNIQSSRKKDDIKNQNLVSIFGETIEKSKSIFQEKFGVNEDNTPEYEFKNEINISGKISKISKIFDNLVKIRISVVKNGRFSSVNMVYYTNNPEKILNTYKLKDIVYITGCVQTTKKIVDGKPHYFENYVINEIKK